MLCGTPLCKAQVLAGLITQTGPQGRQLMRAPQRSEPLSFWLCAPHPSQPRVAWPPASSVLKGGLGSEQHMGKLLQKTQQCFWVMSNCHRLQRLQWGWVGRETEAGCSEDAKEPIFCTALPQGERGTCELCHPTQVPELLCLPWLGE